MINRTSIILYKGKKTQSVRKYFLHNRINQFCCLYWLFTEECKWLILFDSTVELMAPYYHWLVLCLCTPLSGSSLFHQTPTPNLPLFPLYISAFFWALLGTQHACVSSVSRLHYAQWKKSLLVQHVWRIGKLVLLFILLPIPGCHTFSVFFCSMCRVKVLFFSFHDSFPFVFFLLFFISSLYTIEKSPIRRYKPPHAVIIPWIFV